MGGEHPPTDGGAWYAVWQQLTRNTEVLGELRGDVRQLIGQTADHEGRIRELEAKPTSEPPPQSPEATDRQRRDWRYLLATLVGIALAAVLRVLLPGVPT